MMKGGVSGGGTVSSAPTTNGYLMPVLEEQGSSAIVCTRLYPFGTEISRTRVILA